MKAITTHYLGPTNTRGSRIYARAESLRHSVPYDYALDAEGNHEAAARAFCVKHNWTGKLASGTLPDGKTHVHVFLVEGLNTWAVSLPHASMRNGTVKTD